MNLKVGPTSKFPSLWQNNNKNNTFTSLPRNNNERIEDFYLTGKISHSIVALFDCQGQLMILILQCD